GASSSPKPYMGPAITAVARTAVSYLSTDASALMRTSPGEGRGSVPSLSRSIWCAPGYYLQWPWRQVTRQPGSHPCLQGRSDGDYDQLRKRRPATRTAAPNLERCDGDDPCRALRRSSPSRS